MQSVDPIHLEKLKASGRLPSSKGLRDIVEHEPLEMRTDGL